MKRLITAAGMWIWKRRAGILWSIILIATLAVAVYLLPRSLAGQLAGSSARAAVVVVLAILALGLVGHIIHCFTRNLPPLEAKLSRELRSLFLYAYIFQGLMIVVPLAPFAVSSASMSSATNLAGFVHGCVLDEEQNRSGLTRCTDGSTDGQWLLHIGSRPLKTEADADNTAEGGVILTRGLVVPLYVVVLAIIGGAVGMTRRLPELQRRAAYSYPKERRGNDPPTISPTRAREQIVFQIMQVFAAPLIAIVAFSAMEPDTVTAAVLIGFASGFSSEPILMKLRAASEAVGGIPAPRAKEKS